MRFLSVVLLFTSLSVHAQDVVKQRTLVKQALAQKALQALLVPTPLLVLQKTLPRTTFDEVVKQDPEAIEVLKRVQQEKWNLSDPKNFLSFSYDELDDVFENEFGFCSGYTYVTWLLRYLVFFDRHAPLDSAAQMIEKLDLALNQLKPVTINGVANLWDLSQLDPVNRYLKVQIGWKWRDQSITTEGARIYLDQYRNKPVKWTSLNSRVKFYLDHGIYPIAYAVTREPWKNFGKMDEIRMIHVMPIIEQKKYNLEKMKELAFFKANPERLALLNRFVGIPILNLLNTYNRDDRMSLFEMNSNASQLSLNKKMEVTEIPTYLDLIYYSDRISAQVALNLKQAFAQ